MEALIYRREFEPSKAQVLHRKFEVSKRVCVCGVDGCDSYGAITAGSNVLAHKLIRNVGSEAPPPDADYDELRRGGHPRLVQLWICRGPAERTGVELCTVFGSEMNREPAV
jgi:hypothetical protein